MPSVRVREKRSTSMPPLRRFQTRPARRAGILTELRRREFYEKAPRRKRKAQRKAAAIKRHMKRVSRDGMRSPPLGPAHRHGAQGNRITEDIEERDAGRRGKKERLAAIRLALAAIKQRESR